MTNLKVGDRVQISGGSGSISSMTGIIVHNKANYPINWRKEVTVHLDDGVTITITKKSLIRIP